MEHGLQYENDKIFNNLSKKYRYRRSIPINQSNYTAIVDNEIFYINVKSFHKFAKKFKIFLVNFFGI